jgi:hypothetical protein
MCYTDDAARRSFLPGFHGIFAIGAAEIGRVCADGGASGGV